jgi:hypothetical protein
MQVMILRMSETGCSALHQAAEKYSLLLRADYNAVESVVVRKDERDIHVPDHARNVGRRL